MLVAIILAWAASLVIFLGGAAIIALSIGAAAMDPAGRSPWKTVRGELIAGFVVMATGAALLTLLVVT